jgi:hypothetical protein
VFSPVLALVATAARQSHSSHSAEHRLLRGARKAGRVAGDTIVANLYADRLPCAGSDFNNITVAPSG